MTNTKSRPQRRGLSQPALGLAGLPFIVLAVIALGYLPSQASALTTSITIITFGLPVLVVVTLWWNGWPFTGSSRAASGWARFALIGIATVVLAAVGQLITGQLDIGGIFGTAGSFPLFPYGFVLAASVFVTMLQFTFVTGKMPFQRMRPVAGGTAAFISSWVLGLVEYFFLLNWSEGEGKPPAPPIAGTGPIYALDWPAILLSICVLQLVFFVLLGGFPFVNIRQPVLNFIVVNVFTIGGGLLLYVVLTWLGLTGPLISALTAALIAAVILVVILFDGWPVREAHTAIARLLRIVTVSAVATVLLLVLFGIGSLTYSAAPGTPPLDLWVAGVCLNLIAAFAIVHVAVFGRWPLPVTLEPPSAAGTDHTEVIEVAD